ncbi:MAG: hypothetical protein ACKO2C_05820 [Actinomycetes bacterium]
MTAVESVDAPDPRSPASHPARAALAILLLTLVGFVLPLVVARHYGALGAARGDDWSYLLTLFRWVDTGHLAFNGWVSMSLVGQLLLAAPIVVARGNAIALVQAETAVIGLGGLVALAVLGRRLGLSWGVTTFVAVTIAVSPLWLILSTTYMTDVPAFAVSTLAMLLATVAIQRRPVSMPLLVVAFVIAIFSVTIRQYAIVPVVAIVIAGAIALRAEPDRRRAVVGVFAVLLGTLFVVAFFAWWYSVPDAKTLSPRIPSPRSVRTTVIKGAGYFRLAGLLLAPVLCWAGPIRILRRAWVAGRTLTVVAIVTAAGWEAIALTRNPFSQFVGNYVIRDGALSIAVLPGRRPSVVPDPIWYTMVAVGCIGAVLLIVATVPTVVRLVDRVRRCEFDVDPVTSLLGLTVFGFVLAYGLAMVTGVQVHDRYSLPAIAVAALLLARSAPTDRSVARTAAAGVALALLAVIGLNAAVDSASFDGGRWRLAQRIERTEHLRAGQIGGGFEWVNYHRGRHVIGAPARGRDWVLPDGRVVRVVAHCVNLRVRGPDTPANVAPAIASIRYVAPLRPDARIVAVRSSRPCVPPPGATPLVRTGTTAAP